MIDNGVAIALSMFTLGLMILIVLMFTGVVNICGGGGGFSQTKCPVSPIIETMYDYKPGEKPPASINDSSADQANIQGQAGRWSDLWSRNTF